MNPCDAALEKMVYLSIYFHSQSDTVTCISTVVAYLHSTFKEITDVLVSFRDQVEGFPDDLLLCVFILQEEREIIDC